MAADGAAITLTDYSVNELAKGLTVVIAEASPAGSAAAAATPAPKPTAAAAFATPGPPPPSAGALAPPSTGRAPARTLPIAALNPYASGWMLAAKVAGKGPLRTTANGTAVFSAELVDAAGTAIEATFWREAASSLHDTLTVGTVYHLSKGKVKPANKAYASVRNDYCLDFGTGAVAEPAPDQSAAASMAAAPDYVSIGNLSRHVGKKAPIDVIGVVTAVAPLGAVKRKSDDAELARRDITLADASGRTVTLTLWGDAAGGVGAELEAAAADGSRGVPPLLAATRCRVGDYNGVSLSSLGRSVLTIDPPGDAAATTLATWWREHGAGATLQPAGEGLPGARGAGGPRPRASLADLALKPGEAPPPPTAKPEYATIVATFTALDPDAKLWYDADPASGRKVVPRDGGWWCEYDATLRPAMTRRYILPARAADATGEASVTLFDDAAAALLGARADELAELKERDAPAFSAALAAACWRPAVLRVAAKSQEYNGETRRRLVVHSVAPVDWASEAKRAAADVAALVKAEG